MLVYVTNLGKLLKPEDGALSQLFVAAGSEKEDLVNGAFYIPVGEMSNAILDKVAASREFGAELWAWTEKALEGL
jgi:hypothetical protein